MGSGEELLLHVCCAPCSTYVIDVLSEVYSVIAFFYNPNIHPEDEYERRLYEVRRYTALHDIPLIVGEADRSVWHNHVRGLEEEPEGGKRCEKCFAIRLFKTAACASERGIGLFTTTLTVSPHKDFRTIQHIGREAARCSGVSFLAMDFKQNDGYRKSCLLSKQYSLYRQRYCGCLYSVRHMARGQ